MAQRDGLTQWFHDLAEQPEDALIKLASPQNIAQLQTHVALNTPDYPLPSWLSPSEFAQAVVGFRHNESAWNKATMAAIIQADDLFKAGSTAKATALLEAFAASCPWALFKEAALDQATHYDT
jgi:hypothetical protein